MNKKNITTMVLVSLALFIYMLILGTFIPTRPGSIFPTAIGATIGFIVFYVTFGGKLETAYKTDERGEILNDKSATVGFIALSLFLLAYLIKGYFEAGIFDNTLLLTLFGSWVVCVLTRFYYERRM